jgi:dTDP-4-dehydrorhamnose 3,5-epimerase
LQYHSRVRSVKPVKDQPTVTAAGEPLSPRIDGLQIRRCPPLEDERGDLVEVYRPSWGFHPAPLAYVYAVSLRPDSVRGWIVHSKQDDRIFIQRGAMTWAFFDDRDGSPTRGLLNVFTFSDRNRVLFTIPQGVWHAVKNIGRDEAMFINMPTRPYDHGDPDKYRLPIKNTLIPFAFEPNGQFPGAARPAKSRAAGRPARRDRG